MSNGNIMIIHLIVGLMKKIWLYKMSYFPGSNTHIKNKIKIESNLLIIQRNLTLFVLLFIYFHFS